MIVPGGGRGDDVSAELRRRVMRAVQAEPKREGARTRSRRFPVAGALALVWVLGMLATAGAVELRSGGSPTRVIQASVGLGRLRVSGGRAELIVTHLPPPPAGRVYQLWFQRGAGAPAPSTLFTVTSRGTADLGLPGYAAGVTRVLVTIEPPGGSRAPTTRPVIVASLV
ncbi:MAG TPA: anti-sigma factor [Solirubrobacteraceae bacterium]|nr:anti-sigma factor [Solirubrobacteraceae bacterium]